MNEGGLIPKAFYKSETEDGNPSTSLYSDENLYRSAELKPGEYLEIIIRNNEPKSVLTWDFDIMNSDAYFSVYRSCQEVSSPTKDLYKSVFDIPTFKEGKNYYRVEPMLIYHHMESVQGSHQLTTADTYVLQWSCPPNATTPVHIMFYYEKLSSIDYKGSLTSLQSGFSVLSVTSCQSR